MAFKIVNCDNIRESFVAASSTTISLGGAVANSNAISSKLSDGDTSWFVIRNGAEFSEGEFTFHTGTPNTLTQTTVFKSSNSGSAVTFSSGTGEVSIDLPSYVVSLLNLKEITVASATTTDIGAVDGTKILISGTTTITGFGTATNQLKFVRFSGALTLTHNGTSLVLPGAAPIPTAAGDTAIFTSDGSGNWRCYQYQAAAGVPNSLLAQMAQATIKGRASGAGTGLPVDLTASQVATLIGTVGGMLLSKVITFTRDISAAAGNSHVTGFGFNPTSIILLGANGGATAQFCVFVIDSAGTVGGISNDNASVDVVYQSTVTVGNGVSSGANFARATFSYISDGFRLAWGTKTGTPTGTYNFIAIGYR